MTVTMDAAGRLVIPADLRREAALEPGAPLSIRVRDGVVEIEPATTPVTLERRGRLLVATSESDMPVLTERIVTSTRRSVQSRR